jgi:hypothetical protein
VRKRMRYRHDWCTGCDADEEGENNRCGGGVKFHDVAVDDSVIVLLCLNGLRLGACGSELFVLFVVGLVWIADVREKGYCAGRL